MKLQTLRSRLNQLRRRRAFVRQSTAWSAVALAVLWLVAAAFVTDFLLLMNIPQRLVAWAIGLAITAWAFWHYTKPWIGVKEDVVDVALLVERHQHIDSDLVAALQFQESEAAQWGSPQLESAVIEYVEEFSPSLNVFEGFTYRRFKRRMGWLTGTLLVIVAAAALFPDYAAAFSNRMLFGSSRYPTDTKIERITVNGEPVFVSGGDKVALRIAYGTPIDFEVLGRGELPDKGRLRIQTEETGGEVEIELNQGDSNAANSPNQATYRGQLPRLVDSVIYRVDLGDTWSDPLEIDVIPLPVVTISLRPQPPPYAIQSDDELASVREGTRQIAVIEGTSVALDLESTNKPLIRATLTVEDKDYPLRKVDEAGQRWRLDDDDSPLHQIRDAVRYALQVEDEDGLRLPQPIEGFVRIRVDRKPRILPPVLETPLVLPTAVPPIDYQVADDFGLSKLSLNMQVVRKVPMPDETGMMDQVDHIQRDVRVIPPEEQPTRSLAESYALDLSTMKLNPGDELKITLEAFDYRGEFEPQSSISEPLVLKVTDIQGIIRGMKDADERSAQSLDTIIETISGDTK